MSINSAIIAPHFGAGRYSFKATEHSNNIQKESYNSSPVKYFAGATILASVIAIGIIYHKTNYKNNFKNIEDATVYFKKKFGIDADFIKCKDPEYIKALNNVILKLKKMGCKLPKTIDFCSFEENSIKSIIKKYGSTPPEAISPHAYGFAQDKHVFFNTNARPFNNFVDTVNKKQLGHFTSSNPSSLAIKEYIIAHELGHVNGRISIIKKGYESAYGKLPDAAIDNLFKNINRYQNEMFATVKPLVNTSGEVIPETFAKLITNPKTEFSDKTMLLYDLMGGGAIPNMKIKGMPYNEYIKGLYVRWQEILV